MPGGLPERAVMAAVHQSGPPDWIVANRGDLLLSPGRDGNPRCHGKRSHQTSVGQASGTRARNWAPVVGVRVVS
jgi:hypothetical protein